MPKTIYPVICGQSGLPLIPTELSESGDVREEKYAHGLPECELMLTAEGSARLDISGASHTVGGDTALFIAAGVPFSLCPSGSGLTACRVSFSGTGTNELLKLLGFGDHLIVGGIGKTACRDTFKRLFAAASEPVVTAESCSVPLYELLTQVRSAVKMPDTDKYGSGNIIGEAVAFMNSHCGEDISIDRLAAISGVSVQHFCRVFKSKTGMRPTEYLNACRIARSKGLLKHTDMRIGDVAADVGYEDQNYFGISFRKSEGLTPSEYRKTYGTADKGNKNDS